MGAANQRQKSKSGEIFIQLAKNFYFNNEVITGAIILNVVDNNFPHNCIYLKLIGVEEAQKKERRQSGKHSRTVTMNLLEICFEQVMKVHQFPYEMLPSGTHTFPFQFPIANLNLQTYSIQATDRFYGRIQFYLEAYVNSNVQQELKEHIYFEQLITIKRPLQIQPKKVCEEKKDIPITTCCCCGSGQVELRAECPADAFYYGQETTVTVTLDTTRSRKLIKRIVVLLYGWLYVEFGNDRKRAQQITLNEQELMQQGGYTSGQVYTKKTKVQINSEKKEFLQSTFEGKHISYKHYIWVYAEVDGCVCLSGHPTMFFYITCAEPFYLNYQPFQDQSNSYQPNAMQWMQPPIMNIDNNSMNYNPINQNYAIENDQL